MDPKAYRGISSLNPGFEWDLDRIYSTAVVSPALLLAQEALLNVLMSDPNDLWYFTFGEIESKRHP